MLRTLPLSVLVRRSSSSFTMIIFGTFGCLIHSAHVEPDLGGLIVGRCSVWLLRIQFQHWRPLDRTSGSQE